MNSVNRKMPDRCSLKSAVQYAACILPAWSNHSNVRAVSLRDRRAASVRLDGHYVLGRCQCPSAVEALRAW